MKKAAVSFLVIFVVLVFSTNAYLSARNDENDRICFNMVTMFNDAAFRDSFLSELSGYAVKAGNPRIPFDNAGSQSIRYYPDAETENCYLLFSAKDATGKFPSTLNESETSRYALYAVPNRRRVPYVFMRTEAENFFYAANRRNENSKKLPWDPYKLGRVFGKIFEKY